MIERFFFGPAKRAPLKISRGQKFSTRRCAESKSDPWCARSAGPAASAQGCTAFHPAPAVSLKIPPRGRGVGGPQFHFSLPHEREHGTINGIPSELGIHKPFLRQHKLKKGRNVREVFLGGCKKPPSLMVRLLQKSETPARNRQREHPV